MLRFNSVEMNFGGVRAVDSLSFDINGGEIFGLIGPNGAGKTTVFNIATGAYKPSGGEVLLDGERIDGLKPHKIVKKGVARTFQNIRLFDSMSVSENVLIGLHNHLEYTFLETIFRVGRFFSKEREAKARVLELLRYLDIESMSEINANSLSYGDKRKVEIARALATSPKILLLDEPAAGMNQAETNELADMIRKIRDDFNITIFLIEHDMHFVRTLCQRVLVIDYGKRLFEGSPSDAIEDKEVIAAYIGDDVSA